LLRFAAPAGEVRRAMECPNCHYAIAPGWEITLPDVQSEVHLRHCPYCMTLLPEAPARPAEPPSPDSSNVSVNRYAARRRIRERFLDELIGASTDGHPHCPVCAQPLDKNEELELRTGEKFRCRGCSHDLALEAYQRSAYDQERWRPVIELLLELRARSQRCAHCRYLAAMGAACSQALCHMPEAFGLRRILLQGLIADGQWVLPDCDWPTGCAAAAQYRQLAGEGLALL
jgi:hypothetical protein